MTRNILLVSLRDDAEVVSEVQFSLLDVILSKNTWVLVKRLGNLGLVSETWLLFVNQILVNKIIVAYDILQLRHVDCRIEKTIFLVLTQ
jgi:hypothetical protein